MENENKLLEKAIIISTNAHSGQIRKIDSTPYITHPLGVAFLVQKYKKSVNIISLMIVAILHDTVEDTDLTVEEIAKNFGYKIASIVDELTTNKAECQLIGKTKYLSQKMSSMSSYALCIKLCDRLHNLNDLHLFDEETKNKKLRETKEILEYIANERKLTKTHKKIINDINKKLKKISNE